MVTPNKEPESGINTPQLDDPQAAGDNSDIFNYTRESPDIQGGHAITDFPVSEPRIPTVGERADELVQSVDGLLERLWRLQIWDEPSDIADEITGRMKKWVDGFEELCYCNRPGRYCICP